MTNRYQLELLSSYENFKCLGDKCDFTCCSSWRIDIDQPTYEKYLKSDEEDGTELAKNIIVTDAGPAIKLNEKGECPLLDEVGLCSVVCNMGEEFLGNHCTIYPRMRLDYHQSATSRIMLSISCQEASRLTVFNPEPVSLVSDFTDKHAQVQIPMLADDYQASDANHEAALRIIAQNMAEMVQMQDIPIRKRVAAMVFLVEQAQQHQLSESFDNCVAFNNELVTLMESNLSALPDDIVEDKFNQFDLVTRISRLMLKAIAGQAVIYPVDTKVDTLVRQSFEGLGIDDMENITDAHFQTYLTAWQTHVAPYLEQNPHVIENLVAYHLLKGNMLFPAEQNRMSPLLLTMLYVLLIFGLAHGYANYHGTLDDDKLNELLFALHRFIDHSPETQDFLTSVCTKLSATSSEQMYTFF